MNYQDHDIKIYQDIDYNPVFDTYTSRYIVDAGHESVECFTYEGALQEAERIASELESDA